MRSAGLRGLSFKLKMPERKPAIVGVPDVSQHISGLPSDPPLKVELLVGSIKTTTKH